MNNNPLTPEEIKMLQENRPQYSLALHDHKRDEEEDIKKRLKERNQDQEP